MLFRAQIVGGSGFLAVDPTLRIPTNLPISSSDYSIAFWVKFALGAAPNAGIYGSELLFAGLL